MKEYFICSHCHKDTPRNRTDQKFCSNACKQARYFRENFVHVRYIPDAMLKEILIRRDELEKAGIH